jgi:hypothetical protein
VRDKKVGFGGGGSNIQEDEFVKFCEQTKIAPKFGANNFFTVRLLKRTKPALNPPLNPVLKSSKIVAKRLKLRENCREKAQNLTGVF